MTTHPAEWTDVTATTDPSRPLRQDMQDFLSYWQELHDRHGRVPRKSDFEPLNLAGFWRGIAIIEVHRQTGRQDRFRYRFLGTGYDLVNGVSHSGRFMDELLSETELDAVRPVFNAIITDGKPHYWHRQARIPGRELSGYERVLTPFLGAGDTLDFLIGYWVWHWQTGRRTGLRVATDKGQLVPTRGGNHLQG